MENKIYTSYYANYKKFKTYIRIQISRGNPITDFEGIIWTGLMPSSKLLFDHKNNRITDKEYIDSYTTQLELIGFNKIKTTFDKLLKLNRHLVLFCYESPEKFCHRHILADWYNKHAGELIISEYENL